jgi:diguanylate cyclase (GGDEF)-like protein
MRAEHPLGRLGGEEFLLLMPGTSLEEGTVALERVRRTLVPHADVRYTFSAGVAQARAGEALAIVIDRADRALYEAKRQGRNRTSASGEAAAPPPAGGRGLG